MKLQPFYKAEILSFTILQRSSEREYSRDGNRPVPENIFDDFLKRRDQAPTSPCNVWDRSDIE